MATFFHLPVSMMISLCLNAESLPSWVETVMLASWKTTFASASQGSLHLFWAELLTLMSTSSLLTLMSTSSLLTLMSTSSLLTLMSTSFLLTSMSTSSLLTPTWTLLWTPSSC